MSLRAGVPIRDYVNQPKPNGYRSLHSRAVVNGSFGFDAEVQVRTVEMHNYAEYGRAAHWLYKHSEGRRQVAEATRTPTLPPTLPPTPTPSLTPTPEPQPQPSPQP
jgi:(p)ppGpp synthase/HD superfamily hydrolase